MSKKKRKQQVITTTAPIISNPLSSQKTLIRTLLIVCSVFAFALYANTLTHQFTVDDDLVISKNKFTKEGIRALPEIFSTSYRAGYYERKEGLYRPLSVALFAVIWEIAPEKPFLFHLVNVLLYAITAAVLFLFLLSMLDGKNLILPFLITMLFVAHPVHTEVVANVKSSDELLGFLFSILSLWLTLKFVKSNRLSLLAGASLCYFLALLSKESAVVVVIIAPLMLYFFSNPKRNQWIMISGSLIALLGIYFIIRVSVLKGLSDFSSIDLINNSLVAAGDDWQKRIATAIALLGRYIFILFLPFKLCYDYSYDTIPLISFSDGLALLSLMVIIALAVIAARGFKKKNSISFGILFFGISIAIVSNIFILIESTFAERFLYMPSLGFCIAIVFLFAKIFKAPEINSSYSGFTDLLKRNRSLTFFFSFVLILFSVKTFSRNLDWKSNITLLQRDVKTHPNSARIQYAIGSTYVFDLAQKEKDTNRKKEFVQQGINHLLKATAIFPDYGDGWFNLGAAYNSLEDYKNAVPCFDKGFEHTQKVIAPQFIGAGVAYGETGSYQKAFAMFDSVIARNDTSFDAYNNRGMFKSRIHEYDAAMVNLKKAIQINPNAGEPYYNIGNLYAYQENYSTAIEWYEQALKHNPELVIAWGNLGNSYAALKQYDKALEAFQKILSLDPSNEQARYNTGITYKILGDSVKAKEFLPRQ